MPRHTRRRNLGGRISPLSFLTLPPPPPPPPPRLRLRRKLHSRVSYRLRSTIFLPSPPIKRTDESPGKKVIKNLLPSIEYQTGIDRLARHQINILRAIADFSFMQDYDAFQPTQRAV